MTYLSLTGNDFSGAEGTGRTYTILVSNVISTSIDVRLDNNVLIPDTDFSYNSGTQVLTINSYLLNSQYVIIFYSTTTSVASGNLYTTKEAVQEELRATIAFSGSTNPTDTTVDRWIEEYSRVIDDISGTNWGSTQYIEYLDYNAEDRLQLRNSPIISITALEYNDQPLGSTPSWSTMTEGTDFIKYPKYGELLLTNLWSPKSGNRNIKVTYYAGYADIPSKISMLCTMMVAHKVLSTLINNNVNEANDGGSVSVGSISIVEPASYGVNSFMKLKDNIDSLKKELITGFSVLRY